MAALVPKVESCSEALNAQNVGNAFYGLQNISSESAGICLLLSALAPKVESCRKAIDAQPVNNALYDLQNMRSDNAEVHSLLSIISSCA